MRLSWPEIRANAARFSEEWKGKGYEKGQTQSFYDEFFAIFGVPRKQVAVYEQRVKALDTARTSGFIDLFWPGTLIVEQKSSGRDLTRAMAQALDYYDWLPEVQRPRYMMVCDFQRFELVDLESRREWKFPLADLKRHVEAFAFIVGVQPRLFREQPPVNRQASQLMGRLHNALEDDGYVGHQLERLLVRLLFILFADKTGIFERKGMFLDLLERRTRPDGRDLGRWLSELFQVLDTPPEKRQRGLDIDLGDFPYINGDLFRERIDMPAFDNAMRDMLLEASMFDWGEVSPAIFGSLFESVIDKVARRKQGAHYTPEQAILKVIEPLFLDDLRVEFARIKGRKSGRRDALLDFHEKLAGLTFLDPACGAGNFLVVAYREIRELEREVLKETYARASGADFKFDIDVRILSKLNVDQFFGIEIDEFPAMIAQVALWMTDHIANTRLAEDFGQTYARIPLVTAPGVRHADALELDWNAVVPAGKCSFVFGNPPFVGAKQQSLLQRSQVRRLAQLGGSGGTLDYVAAWFLKASIYVQAGHASIGFVATNSICQGEQTAQLWPKLFSNRLEIIFAHQTFRWPGRAKVHCVIIGLTSRGAERNTKRLFSYAHVDSPATESLVTTISPYLLGVADTFRHLTVREEARPINGARRLKTGVQMIDDGHYTFENTDKVAFLADEPDAAALFRRYLGGDEFINGFHRWILYLVDASPSDLRRLPLVRQRVAAVRKYRLSSTRPATVQMANEPTRLGVDERLVTDYLVIPNTSSERRHYIPIGWMGPDSIANQKLRILPSASRWEFAILTSRMHMAYMRAITGRLESRYMYSVGVVYNTFPWPDATATKRSRIELLAQAVLDARTLPKNATSTLADLYDPDTMPAELRRAHRELDGAVERLYRQAPFGSDRERVEHLFTLYQRLVDPLQNEGIRQNRRIARQKQASAANIPESEHNG
ncbi:DNA methyltransferase [Sphingomonas sp. Leaf343]|uniref:DNA methyltransferase n=1 Tax=Sphingomonas sp. Leaf343 TaxID=1736345 RepID=UPI00070222F3|nr:DNA methyltransferase [Sphingomonas sp. Leaf343]KQR80513.1 methylase [Sphingomonas sp. Leaf343]